MEISAGCWGICPVSKLLLCEVRRLERGEGRRDGCEEEKSMNSERRGLQVLVYVLLQR